MNILMKFLRWSIQQIHNSYRTRLYLLLMLVFSYICIRILNPDSLFQKILENSIFVMNLKAVRNFIHLQIETRPLRALKRIQSSLLMYPRKGERFGITLMLKHCIFSHILGLPSIIGVCGYMYQAFLGKKTEWLLSFKEMTVNLNNFQLQIIVMLGHLWNRLST